jgi:hypothetical protein
MGHGRLVNRILESEPKGRRRRMGRPRSRRLKESERNLREM